MDQRQNKGGLLGPGCLTCLNTDPKIIPVRKRAPSLVLGNAFRGYVFQKANKKPHWVSGLLVFGGLSKSGKRLRIRSWSLRLEVLSSPPCLVKRKRVEVEGGEPFSELVKSLDLFKQFQ